MAHRALVAYERSPDRYDLHRSRWGGTDLSLARRITAETPFGGERTGAARVRRGPSTGPGPRPIERRPVATALDFDAVVDAVDFRRHEALFVVAAGYDTTAYLPLWFGLPGVESSPAVDRENAVEQGSTSPRSASPHEDAVGTSSGESPLANAREDAGALVAADPDGGPYGGRRLRRWFRATKAVVADAVALGAFSPDEASAYLADRVREHVGERREVIVRG